MFDMGFAEMLIIGIVALLVIGPERLPSVARKAGAYVAKIKRFVTNVKSDVEREFRTDELQQMLKQQQEELSSLKDIVNETKKDVDLDSIEKSLKESGEEVMADYNAMSAPDEDVPGKNEPQTEKISS